jgi:hypothetical protein
VFKKILVANHGEIACRLSLVACILLVAGMALNPAYACSGPRQGKTAEERTAGVTGLRTVAGTLRLVRMEPPKDRDDTARLFARITTKRGAALDVSYFYDEDVVLCMRYLLPRGDASGRFYLRANADGQYELVDWSGKYIEGNVIPWPDEER